MSKQPDPLRIDFHLLDRQIVDSEGGLVGNVDDLELSVGPDGVPRVAAILVGLQPLGDRLGGTIGRWFSALGRRLSMPDNTVLRIPYTMVTTVGSEITLAVRRDQLVEPPLESWLREHLIGRIPGADHEGQ